VVVLFPNLLMDIFLFFFCEAAEKKNFEELWRERSEKGLEREKIRHS